MKQNQTLHNIYNSLYQHFGPQGWWPGDTPFEVIVGAILTQNTNWNNVEKAIANLKKAKVLTPQKLHALTQAQLAKLITPAGFFNIKAKRLRHFLDFLFTEYQGRIELMAKEDLSVLREKLLSVNGIGPETADSILLYAFNKPIFVVDAYTKRFMSRHGLIDPAHDYHDVQGIYHKELKADEKHFNEYHALIVKLNKEFCKTKQRCEGCPLNQPSYWEKNNEKSILDN